MTIVIDTFYIYKNLAEELHVNNKSTGMMIDDDGEAPS
jgi:hypothetical protein